MAEDITTITVFRAPGRDRFGDPLPGPTITFQIAGCRFAPQSSLEFIEGANQTTVNAMIYGPPDMDIRHTDQVEVFGTRYEVGGEPEIWGSFGTAVPLHRVTG